MPNASKQKGDRAEREAAALLTETTKYTVKRRFGAGATLDESDLYGIPGFAVQICDWANKTDALRQKPPEADQQAVNALAAYAVTGIRLRGGDYRWVMTTASFAKLVNALNP